MNRRDAEDDIRETVYRQMMSESATTIKPSAAAYFLGLGPRDEDPPLMFMVRFEGQIPPVYRFSRCKITAGKGVLDRISGEEGVAFSITGIKWVNEMKAVVTAGYYESMVNSATRDYQVARGEQGWKVVTVPESPNR
jgi:hypothetical protein